MFSEKQKKLIKEMVEKHMCCSYGEARRLVLGMDEEKIREKLSKIKIVKRVTIDS